MEKGEKELVHEAVIKYNLACDTLLCRVAESHSGMSDDRSGFQGKMQEFENDCYRMRKIMEDYETYLENV